MCYLMTAPKWYDFTQKKAEIKLPQLIDALNQMKVDKFVIGEEIGKDGYEHYQGRVQFKKPYTMNELVSFNHKWGITAHWSPTSANCHDFDYCMKEGKFYRSWEGALAKYHDLELRDWQKLAVGALGASNDRNIIVIIDKEGGNGKSTLGKYLEVNHILDYCPVNSGEAGEYVAYCLGYQAKGYLFDIPRCDTIKDKKQMWKAIEQIKNGCLYDGRYSPRKVWIEPPMVMVFTNDIPPLNHLSIDRWVIHELIDGELQSSWTPEAVRNMATLQELYEEQEKKRRKSGDP